MSNLKFISTIVVIVALYSCPMFAQSSPPTDSGIEGVISVGPVSGGPSRIGTPDSKPLANADFVVQTEKGVVKSFTTDSDGHFRVLLPPGHYVVSMKDKKPAIGYYGPFEVDVQAGKVAPVQWRCDTGMR